MADYVSILDKAVSGLAENSPGNRAVIYDKARAAIERKLRAMDPLPPEAAIARQLEQLEIAIGDVEARHSVPVAGKLAPEEHGSEFAVEAETAMPDASAPFAPVEIPVKQKQETPLIEIRVPDGFIDEPILIDGIGEKTAKLLADKGVTKISQIAAMSDADLADLTHAIGYPGFEITQEWKRQSLDMLSGGLPRGKSNQERLAKLFLEAETHPDAPTPETEAPPVADATWDAPETVVKEPDAGTPAKPDVVKYASSADEDYKAFLDAFANADKGAARAPSSSGALPLETQVAAEPAPEPSPEPAPSEVAANASREPFRPQVPVFEEPFMPEPVVPGDRAIPPASDAGSFASPETDFPAGRVPDPVHAPGRPGAAPSPDFLSHLENDPQTDGQRAQSRAGNNGSRQAQRPLPPLKPKKGNSGKVISGSLTVLLLGAAAAGAYYFREPIIDLTQKGVVAARELLSIGEPASSPAGNGSKAVEPEATDAPAKDTSRLGSGESTPEPAPVAIETIEPKPAAPEPVQAPEPTIEPVAPATVEVQGESGQSSGNGAATDTATDTTTGSQPAVEADATDQEALDQAVSAEGTVLTGEKSYLYEEAAGSTGASRDEGSMSWSLVNEPPEEGVPSEPVIKGVMDIPGRGLVLNLSIKRNVDPALSASHLIELIFTAPAEFSGGNVDNISRFVMKASEQARGESLVGVPARIDTGYFLIALNNLDQALKTNLNLLENGDWMDIPVAYVTGRRALITFEKGASGKEVFANALADWKNR